MTITPKSHHRPHQRQYPLRKEAEEGISPVIQDLLKAGIIIPCPDSPCNTPLFPVKKQPPSVGWRMVQDLQAVNQAVVPRAPVVPDPHTLLNDLSPDSKVFSVIDISNAFFSIPIHPDHQFWFAFTYKGKRYTFTRLSQGYCESPTIFAQAMSANLAQFEPPGGSQLLLYVDDILLASPTKEICALDAIALLHFLCEQGHKVNRKKLQFCQDKVRYLGYNISKEGKHLDDERIQAILQVPKPKTKKQMMSFLGMANFCRTWIPNYLVLTAPLVQAIHGEPMAPQDDIQWNEENETAFTELKRTLTSTSVLGLPNYEKPFEQTVDSRDGHMTSVLTQTYGGKQRPIAYYSTKLDNVTRALPPCV